MTRIKRTHCVAFALALAVVSAIAQGLPIRAPSIRFFLANTWETSILKGRNQAV